MPSRHDASSTVSWATRSALYLWKKVRRGLSAGRVQSVALRLICEREEEIKAFVPEEFWSLTALLEGKLPPQFEAKLLKKDEEKLRVKNNDEVQKILADLQDKPYTVGKVDKKERRRNPVAPFTTSKLQQEGGRKLGFTARRTMGIAQSLYEGVDVGAEGTVGLITYMRTDSTRVGQEAQDEARELIVNKYGKEYLPEKPPVYASAKSAQEAHEAVRPTSVMREPDAIKQYLEPDQYKLYKLIWNRFVASQMNPAVIDQTSVDIKAGDYTFRATGSIVKFAGIHGCIYGRKGRGRSPFRGRQRRGSAAAAGRRRRAHAYQARPETALHPAASAVLRSPAREDARRERDRHGRARTPPSSRPSRTATTSRRSRTSSGLRNWACS